MIAAAGREARLAGRTWRRNTALRSRRGAQRGQASVASVVQLRPRRPHQICRLMRLFPSRRQCGSVVPEGALPPAWFTAVAEALRRDELHRQLS